jgi:putative membrane protein
MKLLSETDKKTIADAIQKAEATTSGEIVFTVADASAQYRSTTLWGSLIGMAFVTALYLLLPFSHHITALLWTEIISFGFFIAVLPHMPLRRLLIPKQEMDARVHEAAFMQFYSSGLYRTRESNGVEIYLSIFERRVVVIGDKGIHEKMGNPHWDNVRDLIIQGIKTGQACRGICDAIESCGKALAQYFPPRPDDINELSDRVIERS